MKTFQEGLAYQHSHGAQKIRFCYTLRKSNTKSICQYVIFLVCLYLKYKILVLKHRTTAGTKQNTCSLFSQYNIPVI